MTKEGPLAHLPPRLPPPSPPSHPNLLEWAIVSEENMEHALADRLDTPLLRRYPFLLPSLISAGFSVLCLALAVPLLQETPQWLRRNAAASAGGSGVTDIS